MRSTSAALLALGVALAGCGEAAPDEPVATAACAAPERPTLQEGSHLIGDTPPPVPYSSTPPSSGWHASGPGPAPGVYETQLPDPSLVSALEQGRVVLTLDGGLDEDARAVVADLAATLPELVVAPYDTGGEAAATLVAWGVLQRCDELVGADVTTFAEAYGGVDREA